MEYKQNLHTHSIFDDGNDILEDMVLTAIKKGFDSIGFSGHTYTPFSLKYCMTPEKSKKYSEEVKRLKNKYASEIKIFHGLEVERLSNVELSGYDYLIWSAHYFDFNGKIEGFDRSADAVKAVIDTYFNSDAMKFAEAYYKILADLPKHGKFDIVGHFDLITKNCEKYNFFDINSKKYLDYAFTAIAELAGKIPFFEVNTGAIARGYRTTPYPSIPIIKEFKRLGFGATISSDCHNKDLLDCKFDLAEDLLKECGFKNIFVLTESGFKPVKL